MTKVVFSDGSKAMAHNLDDQYQRWMMRRESASEIVEQQPDYGLSEFVPDLPEFESFAQIDDCAQALIDKKVYVAQALLDLETNRYLYGKREFILRRGALGLASQKLQAQQSALKLAQKRRLSGVSNTIHELKAKVDEQNRASDPATLKQLALTRAEALEHSHAGEERQIEELRASGATFSEREARQEEYIQNLKSQLLSTQDRLLRAYERIMEMQND